MEPYLIGILAGYVFGSIPSAYLIVRRRSGIDIRAAGSGNVGSFNAFVVTKSVGTGVLVGILDGLKGLVVVLGATLLWAGFWPVAVALLGAILGHIYPFLLRFRGGRGLATACGGLFGIGLIYTIVWCLTWAAMKLSGARILTANIVSVFVAVAVIWIIPGEWMDLLTWFPGASSDFRIFCTILSGLLLLGHLNVFFGGGEPSHKTQGAQQ